MFNLSEDQVDAMRARIVFENHPGARNFLLKQGIEPKDAKLIQSIVSVAKTERRLTFVCA